MPYCIAWKYTAVPLEGLTSLETLPVRRILSTVDPVGVEVEQLLSIILSLQHLGCASRVTLNQAQFERHRTAYDTLGDVLGRNGNLFAIFVQSVLKEWKAHNI